LRLRTFIFAVDAFVAAGHPFQPSYSAKAEYPVRSDFAVEYPALWNIGSPDGACHRAARSADPVADDDCEY
jgi:hypothetical protein